MANVYHVNLRRKEKLIEPKKYKVKENVDVKNILNCGFQSKSDRYRLNRELYDHYVYANIVIEKEDHTLNVNVYTNDDGLSYGPFYDPEWRHDNLVYEEVVRKYNLFMDKLVKRNILEYDDGGKINMDAFNVKVKKLNDNAKIPTQESEFAAGYDLYACTADNIKIKPGETAKVGTGLSMELPEGYFGAIFARSGLAAKQGLRPANCTGVCDADYRGEYIVALHNDSSMTRVIKNGDRIAQLILLPYQKMNFVECEDLTDTKRGTGGFGSTGKN